MRKPDLEYREVLKLGKWLDRDTYRKEQLSAWYLMGSMLVGCLILMASCNLRPA